MHDDGCEQVCRIGDGGVVSGHDSVTDDEASSPRGEARQDLTSHRTSAG
jgi:hypothetical protein